MSPEELWNDVEETTDEEPKSVLADAEYSDAEKVDPVNTMVMSL